MRLSGCHGAGVDREALARRPQRPLRLVSLLEADSVTGPAKAIIEFCREAGPVSCDAASSAVDACVLTFRRSGDELQRQESRATLERALRDVAVRHEIIRERFRFDLRVIGALRSSVHSLSPDIIESHGVKSHWLIWSSGLWQQLPWLAYHHGYTSTDAKTRIYNLADRVSLRAADRVITVAEAFVPILVSRGVHPGRVRVLHNALAPAATRTKWSRSSARTALGLPDSMQVVLSIARLSREKNVAAVLRAFAAMLARRVTEGAGAVLFVVGDGPERQRIERLARTLGITDRTRFIGHGLDPSLYCAAADVLVIASISEGSPYTLLEALSAGVPVVATTVGGIPEMLSDGIDALLVQAADHGAMACALSRILSDRRLAESIAANGRIHVAEKFSAKVRADRLLRVFAEVCEERRAGPGAG